MTVYLQILLIVIAMIVVSSCGQGKRPFEAEYTSRNDVTIIYQGKNYHLNRFQPTSGLPFEYSFEEDGDLDVIINDRRYEVDSPYDIDKKKVNQKTTKKKTYTKKKKSKK